MVYRPIGNVQAPILEPGRWLLASMSDRQTESLFSTR